MQFNVFKDSNKVQRVEQKVVGLNRRYLQFMELKLHGRLSKYFRQESAASSAPVYTAFLFNCEGELRQTKCGQRKKNH